MREIVDLRRTKKKHFQQRRIRQRIAWNEFDTSYSAQTAEEEKYN